MSISLAVLIGFAINYGMQYYCGPRPSPLKLMMLVSGIGIWWFAMLCVDNLILGIALFDICHDVQYLAIVWLYNSRRVRANPELGGFMKYVFRRGMVLLYLGLITAYGAIALVAPLVLDGTVRSIAYGILFTSTILHYYYDGFIWKVREPANQAGLGLSQNAASSRVRPMKSGAFLHFLKCGPWLIALGLMFATDFVDPSLTTTEKENLDQLYSETLMGKSVLPSGGKERSWLYAQFERAQNIAVVVPDDRSAFLQELS